MVGALAAVRGIAIQTRVNMETMDADGSVVPTAGTLAAFSPPSGPGVRVDTFGRAGLTPSPRYDSLLAKVITRVRGSSMFSAAVRKAQTALDEFGIEGIRTNIGFLREILSHSHTHAGPVTTELRRREPVRVRRCRAVVGATRPGLRRRSCIRARKCCGRNWPAP